jgi:hypothetical protein
MFKDLCDKINPGDNVIVAIGDSFTQGIGAYSLQSWFASRKLGKPYTFNISGNHYRDEQAKNNWASQLRDRHFPDYKVWNLGIGGCGNRAAVKELHLNPLPKNLGNVIVILMATGMERFDFLKNNYETAGAHNHQKWQTIWPLISNRGSISVIEKVYLELLYSEKVIATEFLLNVAEAQHFCKANNYKFLFASAFDGHIVKEKIVKALTDEPELADIVDWNDFVKPEHDESYMEMLCRMENNPKYKKFSDIQDYLHKIAMPLKYLTPCRHWTIEGQAIVADHLAENIKDRKLA